MDAFEQGCTRRAACAWAGISDDTLRRWEIDDATVADDITRAENIAEAHMTMVLTKAAKGVESDSWRAAESWLKRRRKPDYGDNLATSTQGMTDEQLRNIVASGSGIPVQSTETTERKTTIVVQYVNDNTSTASPQQKP